MGLIETIDALDLSDDVKETLRQEHSTEIANEQAARRLAEVRSRKSAVTDEMKELGLDDAEPGLKKLVRRVLLSDDQQPGTVLLSDADLELSDEERIGATSREEISTADVVRQIFKALPKNQEGKIKALLSDQLLPENNHSQPPSGEQPDPAEQTKQRKENIAKVTGLPVAARTRSRYSGLPKVSGGDN